MNQEIKEKWLTRLKTTKKGTGRMRNKVGGYCCLGVLCDVYVEETGKGAWRKEKEEYGFGWHFFSVEGLNIGVAAFLPSAVREWANLDRDVETHLSLLNDSQPGFPIKEIERL